MTIDATDDGLFPVERLPFKLSDRFGVPPFSVLDRRQGEWQDAKRRWMALGIQSEVGRDRGLTYTGQYQADGSPRDDFVGQKLMETSDGTSVFDPMLAETAYRWYSKAGHSILDPFAGGSVRGIVASHMGRRYTGVDLRAEQVDANYEQIDLAATGCPPYWVAGDALDVRTVAPGGYDMIFSCPPYADLEVYSDDPRDLSTMNYPAFLDTYRQIIAQAVGLLRPHRFAGWVISDVRGKDGAYMGLVYDTVRAFEDCGMRLWNDHIILDPVSTLAVRAGRQFDISRKAGRAHQHMLVFVKGNGREAADHLTDGQQKVVWS